jgi:hypothetical protein
MMPLQISGGNQRPHYPQISTLTTCIGAKMVDNRFRFEGLIKALCALASERGNLNDRVDAAISRLPITPPTQMRNATMSVSALH